MTTDDRRRTIENAIARLPSVGYGAALVALTAVGGLLRFWAIGDKTVWLDEAFSIWLARHTIPELISWLVKIDQHPPLYYVLLHSWLWLFGDLQGAVRSLSALCSTLTIPIFFLAARRLVGYRAGLLATVLLVAAPFHIVYAQEARMYALLALAGAATLYCLAVLLDEPSPPGWLWSVFGLAQASAMWTHNTAVVYLPAAINGALIMAAWQQKRFTDRPFLQTWFLSQGWALLLWLPWLPAFIEQSMMVDREFWIPAPTTDAVFLALHGLTLAYMPDWVRLPHDLWGWLIVALALFGLWTQRKRFGLPLLILFLIPPLIALTVSLRRPIFADRSLIWITLPWLMLIGAGIEGAVWGAWRANQYSHQISLNTLARRSVEAALVLLLLFLSAASIRSYFIFAQKEGWDDAAAYIAANARQGELVLINATWTQIPFEYYLRHKEVELELRGLPVDLFERGVLEPKMHETDLLYMRTLMADQQSVWLVYSHDWYTDPQQIIITELARQMEQTGQQDFSGLRIFRFERR